MIGLESVNFIDTVRKEKDIKIEQLCEGLCSQGFYSKILMGEKTPGKILINLLCGRIGIAREYYESYMGSVDYKWYRMRHDIINAIENKNVDEARKIIEKYKKDIGKSNSLHERFILQAESQIMIIERASDEEIWRKLKNAVLITVPRFDEVKLSSLLLGFDELFLIAEYADFVRRIGQADISQKIYDEILEYIESTKCDDIIKSKIYPKVVCLASEKYFKQKQYKKILTLCDKSIVCLQNSGRLHYMTEILEHKEKALAKLIEFCKNDKISDGKLLENYELSYSEAAEWKFTLKSLYEEFDAVKEPFSNGIAYSVNELYFTGQVIKRRRKMLGMTRKELCENGLICSKKTLGRMEDGATNTYPIILSEILKKLNLPGYLHGTKFISSDPEMYKLADKLNNRFMLFEYKDAQKLLNAIECKLDMKISANRQYFGHAKTVIEKKLGVISSEEALDDYKKALYITLSENNIFKDCDKFFTKLEVELITCIAFTLEDIGDVDGALAWYKPLIDYYKNLNRDVGNYIVNYEVVLSNYESLLGNIGRYEESLNIVKIGLHEIMRNRRGHFLANFLCTIPWTIKVIAEKEEKREMQPDEKALYIDYMQKAFNLSCIMKNEVLQEFIKGKISKVNVNLN